MKTAAIIAEFNPFHNGHKFLLDTVKKEYDVDFCIAIMSGDFVQRGDAAIISKHNRAEEAIRAGFSAVFELPLLYATASAPDFAYGACCIANALGVDYLFFGSESGDINSLTKISEALASPSEELNAAINYNAKNGMSYAKSVSEALKSVGICSQAFSSPNDILAVEYIKALKELNSSIIPMAIKRIGVDHDSSLTSYNFASATRIRNLVQNNENTKAFVPYDINWQPLLIDDFSDMLNYRLHYISDDELRNTPGISEDLANKIKKCSTGNFRNLVEQCKSKNFSESTIRRAFIHILLNIQKSDYFYPQGRVIAPDSVRLLAVSKSDTSLLKTFKDRDAITIYTKPKEIIDANDLLLLLDMKASDLYEKVFSGKYKKAFVADCQKTPTVI